jgi:hypothetical protein
MKPSKVFFAINLIRQKSKLPKLEYPKRKLAVTPEQLMAVEALYEPFLPVPPIGVHKIISKQLKMDEWRVHVAIGLIRKNKSLNRWNEDREDLPETMKESLKAKKLQDEQEAAAKEASEKEAGSKESAEATEKKAAKKVTKITTAEKVSEDGASTEEVATTTKKTASKTTKAKSAAQEG